MDKVDEFDELFFYVCSLCELPMSICCLVELKDTLHVKSIEFLCYLTLMVQL